MKTQEDAGGWANKSKLRSMYQVEYQFSKVGSLPAAATQLLRQKTAEFDYTRHFLVQWPSLMTEAILQLRATGLNLRTLEV